MGWVPTDTSASSVGPEIRNLDAGVDSDTGLASQPGEKLIRLVLEVARVSEMGGGGHFGGGVVMERLCE